jgi:hypothetical protein
MPSSTSMNRRDHQVWAMALRAWMLDSKETVTSLVDFQAVDSFAEHLRKKLSFVIIEADLILSLWPDACGVDRRVDHRDGRAWS